MKQTMHNTRVRWVLGILIALNKLVFAHDAYVGNAISYCLRDVVIAEEENLKGKVG